MEILECPHPVRCLCALDVVETRHDSACVHPSLVCLPIVQPQQLTQGQSLNPFKTDLAQCPGYSPEPLIRARYALESVPIACISVASIIAARDSVRIVPFSTASLSGRLIGLESGKKSTIASTRAVEASA